MCGVPIEELQEKLFLCMDDGVRCWDTQKGGYILSQEGGGLAWLHDKWVCVFVFSFVLSQLITCSHTGRRDSHAIAFTQTAQGYQELEAPPSILCKKDWQTKLNKTERNKTAWALCVRGRADRGRWRRPSFGGENVFFLSCYTHTHTHTHEWNYLHLILYNWSDIRLDWIV